MLKKWIKLLVSFDNDVKANPNEEVSIETLREDIANKYRVYGEVYNPQIFDINKFHKRYNEALRNANIDIKIFLLTEIEALDVFVKRFEEKRKKEEAEKKQGSAMASLYGEYRERIKKYTRVELHQNAAEEIERLYGCMLSFSEKHLKSLLKIYSHLTKPYEQDMFRKLEVYFNDLLPGTMRKHPKDFQHYIDKISYLKQADKDEVERIGQEILRRVFFFLRELIKVMNFFKADADIKFQTLNFVLHGKAGKYADYEIALMNDVDQILKDFRLSGLF